MSEEKAHMALTVAPQEQLQRIHPLVAQIAENIRDPESLGRLLDVQMRYEADESRKAFTIAFVAMKQEMPAVIPKDARVEYETRGGGKAGYNHTSLPALMTLLEPLLAKHGFVLHWLPGTNERGHVTVKAVLHHALGHSADTTLSAPPDKSGAKSDPQAVASTATLLARYTAMQLLGLVSGDMANEPGARGPEKPEAERVEVDRNMKAALALRKSGRSVADMERELGRKVAEWTGADLDKIRGILKPTREPGSEG